MSKELKALEKISKEGLWNIVSFPEKEFAIIETALKDYENLKLKHRSMQDAVLDDFNKFKALEIIKKKRLNLEYLKCCENYEQYKTLCSYFSEINRDEFDLLKEVLQ